jgi:hypothetical protein
MVEFEIYRDEDGVSNGCGIYVVVEGCGDDTGSCLWVSVGFSEDEAVNFEFCGCSILSETITSILCFLDCGRIVSS